MAWLLYMWESAVMQAQLLASRKVSDHSTYFLANFWIIPARPQPVFFGHFWICMSHLWVKRGLKMILSHRAPSSLNMSSYQAIWTHFRPNFIFVWPNKSQILAKNPIFLKCKSHHLAILINIWHIWEDRSRKVNNDEPDLRFCHGNFWPVMSQVVRKACFSAWIPRGANFWKPWSCGYVAAGAFFSRKKGPHISGSP